MRRLPRLVIDTNVLVSAFLWQGLPGRLLELAGDRAIRVYTSKLLRDELLAVLQRKKLAKAVRKTGATVAELLADFDRLAVLVPPRQLATSIVRDADDDAVIACALAARADFIVSGDDDLLSLGSFAEMPILTPRKALALLE